MNDGMNARHKAAIRLVRYVASHGPARMEIGQGEVTKGDLRVFGRDGASRQFSQGALERALSAGLLTACDGRLAATIEARPFLRRTLLAPEEAFQEQHRDSHSVTASVEGDRQTVRINMLESPLGAIARLKEKSGQAFLPPEALAAGERLHADFTRAQLQPRLTMAYEPRLSSKVRSGAGSAADISDTALAARMRVGKAMDAIGPELCGVALDICCFQKGLELVERERQWPARSAKLMLRTALMALARHYAPPRSTGRQAHAWGADGYRPDRSGLETGTMPKGAGRPRP